MSIDTQCVVSSIVIAVQTDSVVYKQLQKSISTRYVWLSTVFCEQLTGILLWQGVRFFRAKTVICLNSMFELFFWLEFLPELTPVSLTTSNLEYCYRNLYRRSFWLWKINDCNEDHIITFFCLTIVNKLMTNFFKDLFPPWKKSHLHPWARVMLGRRCSASDHRHEWLLDQSLTSFFWWFIKTDHQNRGSLSIGDHPQPHVLLPALPDLIQCIKNWGSTPWASVNIDMSPSIVKHSQSLVQEEILSNLAKCFCIPLALNVKGAGRS